MKSNPPALDAEIDKIVEQIWQHMWRKGTTYAEVRDETHQAISNLCNKARVEGMEHIRNAGYFPITKQRIDTMIEAHTHNIKQSNSSFNKDE